MALDVSTNMLPTMASAWRTFADKRAAEGDTAAADAARQGADAIDELAHLRAKQQKRDYFDGRFLANPGAVISEQVREIATAEKLRAALREALDVWDNYAEIEDEREQLARIVELRKLLG